MGRDGMGWEEGLLFIHFSVGCNMPSMELPDLPDLRKEVEEMQELCPKIRLNFEFKHPI